MSKRSNILLLAKLKPNVSYISIILLATKLIIYLLLFRLSIDTIYQQIANFIYNSRSNANASYKINSNYKLLYNINSNYKALGNINSNYKALGNITSSIEVLYYSNSYINNPIAPSKVSAKPITISRLNIS